MKTFFFTAILFIVLGAAWMLYLEYDRKQFEKSLSTPPQTDVLTEPENTRDNDATEVDLSEPILSTQMSKSLVETDTQPDSEQSTPPDGFPTLDFDFHDAFEDSFQADPQITDAIEVDLRPPPGMSISEWRDNLSPEKKQALYLQKPWLKPVQEMTLQEIESEVERRKRRLIEQYGNTPEVQIVNKYTTVGSLVGGTSRTMTGDEGVKYARAISVLWPTPENVSHYKLMKSLQENGWHVD